MQESSAEPLRQIFQREYARIVAVIARKFGLAQIEAAEDIVAGTFLLAAEAWGMRGVPDNPAAWLYTAAKNRALQEFRRKKVFDEKVRPALLRQPAVPAADDLDFSGGHIRDSQLRMIFAICHPAIAAEAQIGLALRILCGFGIDEIAGAFLTNKETINKRLFRAREKLRAESIGLDMPPAGERQTRLNNVLRVIYLLFNEGYYSSAENRVLRKELCVEALRLGSFLAEFPETDQPDTRALMALMCYHASRLDARQTSSGEYILYEDQDESKWDRALIAKGDEFLQTAGAGRSIGPWHLEAAIARWHCVKEDNTEKWASILGLYDLLLCVNPSPAARLNRLYALYKVAGSAVAIPQAEALGLAGNRFYHVLLGELYADTDTAVARLHFEKALSLAKTDADRNTLRRKLDKL